MIGGHIPFYVLACVQSEVTNPTALRIIFKYMRRDIFMNKHILLELKYAVNHW